MTRYSRRGASSRVRVYQYGAALQSLGVDCTFQPLLGEDYLRSIYDGEKASRAGVLRSYSARLRALMYAVPRHDLTLVQKELFPFLPHLIESRLLRSFAFDIDDAIHLRHQREPLRYLLGNKVQRVLNAASVVIAGNHYLSELAKHAGNTNVHVVPSVVPVEEYVLRELPTTKDFRIGWIGSANTVHYLERLRPVFESLGREGPVVVVVVGASFEPGSRFQVETHPWSEATEKTLLSTVHAGIMPLDDTEWERGKCAYKAVQYMAAGRAVVASRVGANIDVINEGETGYLAVTDADWTAALRVLQSDAALTAEMGRKGRERAAHRYSVQAQAPQLAAALRSARRDP